jgi:uncharacterized protein (TIGR03663 family)
MSKIVAGEKVVYEPEFHGFGSWYIASIPIFIFGKGVFWLRFMSAVFGAGTVALLFALRKHLGAVGTLAAAVFLAFSPAMISYSRMLIQHGFFVFFLLLLFVCVVQYLTSFKNKYLYAAAVSAAFLLTIHEYMYVFVFVGALFVAMCYLFDFSGANVVTKFAVIFKKTNKRALFFSGFLFSFAVVFMMSNFFADFDNLSMFLKSHVAFQFKKAIFWSSVNRPAYYYFTTFRFIEMPLLAGFFAGFFFLKRTVFNVFILFWCVMSATVLSMIPYKIPWLFMVVFLPMSMAAGIGFENINKKLQGRLKRNVFAAIFVLLVVYSISVSSMLVYAQPLARSEFNWYGPTKEAKQMIEDLNGFSRGRKLNVLMSSGQLYAINYYLEDFDVVTKTASQKWSDFYLENFDLIIVREVEREKIALLPWPFTSFVLKKYEVQNGLVLDVLYKKR